LRLILLYQLNRYDVVCRAAPDLDKAFAALGMEEDRIKFRIVWAASLKVSGRLDEALDILKPLREARAEVRPGLYGWVLLQSGDIHQICGDYGRAIPELMEAARLLREGNQLTGLAEVCATLSGIFRSQGMLGEAIKFLESSREEHERLGMKWCEAYKRMLIAETLLAMGRPRDAEVEIRAAIPVLEEQGMVADAVVAVNLLREAIQRQRSGSQAPSKVRPKH
jgi:tetratricopeptide (TPR) repeat protein